jgi:hypothetical protein
MTTMKQQAVPIEEVADHANGMAIELILFSLDRRVWLLRNDDGGYSLPLIWIPKWRRVAQEAIEAAADTMGLDIFCLWETREREDRYLVARVNNPAGAESDLTGVLTDELSVDILDEDVLRIVATAHGEAFRPPETSTDGPFKRIDWDLALQERLEPTLKSRGLELRGRPQQVNASETFSLLRLETTGSPLWFKAVGAPNLAEYSMTLGIHDLFPGIVPSLIARIPEWNGWVTEESLGKRLDSSTNLDDWKRATTRLADLQVSSLQYLDDLFRAGAVDCRTFTLIDHLDRFTEAMQRAMLDDQDLKTTRLDRHQIDLVANAVREAIAGIVALGVPDALVHRDLSGGNIQISAASCHFIDWAQACIGLPFICSEYMKVHLASAIGTQPNSEPQVAELSDAYASRWSKVLTPEQIRSARQHAPILAEYLYVTPMDGRTALDFLGTREQRAMMRSMVRRMWREMQIDSSLELRGKEARYA